MGLHCEWNYVKCKDEPENALSILQISTRENVFLIDFLTLSEVINEEFSEHFMRHVFFNPNITKIGCILKLFANSKLKSFFLLGYSFGCQFRKLQKEMGFLEGMKEKFLDLRYLSANVFQYLNILKISYPVIKIYF
jgi:hypothetical protein